MLLPAGFTLSKETGRHSGSANLLFADGHALAADKRELLSEVNRYKRTSRHAT
ncbi:MAG: hypothetical protein J5654_04260 [Victivallales bacterium]|nr:hypothetical protein [Victivallales bacterium]